MLKWLIYTKSTATFNHKLFVYALTISLIFLMIIFPNNSYALKLEKIDLSIPVENRVYFYDESENTLTKIPQNYTVRNPSFFEIKKKSNNFFIIYSYTYGDVINTIATNNSDGIEAISISLQTVDDNGKKIETKLENYILPNKTCNIMKFENLKKGYYQLTIHTTTIANEYSDFFSYGREIRNISTYFLKII